ncbi:heme exporter protein CcmB [Hirschia litorea]|uniref:Heme exporter protein B n=1 Tax=Hirschia litorea TaxID=1199156 RepID=A0ABW2IMH2_9PROT
MKVSEEAMSAQLLPLLWRELRLAWGGGGGAALPVGFYAGAATLTPLALGPAADLLRAAGPGILYISLALASLLPMERLFQADLEDGTLDVVASSGVSMTGVALTKTLAHWTASGLPLAMVSPLLWVMLLGPGHAVLHVFAVSLFGGLAFFFIGSIGAALTAGVRRGGLLIALVALPLYAPATIFGASALYAVSEGRDWTSAMALCGACALAAIALGPFAAGAALKTALD